MNRKQFFTLLVIGLLVGGLGWYFAAKRKESYSSSNFDSGQKVLPKFPVNEVATVRIKGPTNEVNLVKGDVWAVKERWNYPAEYSAISEFLRTVLDLEPVQEVAAGPSQHGRLLLVNPETGKENAGTLVEFKNASNAALNSLLLGKTYTRESAAGPFGGGGEYPAGRYVMVPGGESPKIWLVNQPFSNVETDPAGWLDKNFIKIEKLKSVAVTYPDSETNSWALSRETENGQWAMADVKEGENFDAAKASSLNYAMSSPTFNDIASPEASPEQTGMNEPIVAKLETFDGFQYTLRVGGQTNENRYLRVEVNGSFASERTPGADEKPEDKEKLDKEFTDNLGKLRERLQEQEKFEKWTYLVSNWTVDSLLKDRGEFMGEKKSDSEKPAASTPVNLGEPPIDVLPPELRNLPKPVEPPKPDGLESE